MRVMITLQVLGPKGLMPNVKMGTLTSDVAAAVRDMRRGRLDFRCDRDGIVHAGVGKVCVWVGKGDRDGIVHACVGKVCVWTKRVNAIPWMRHNRRNSF